MAAAGLIVISLFAAIFVLVLVTLILNAVWIKDGSITSSHAEASFALNVTSSVLVALSAIFMSVVAAFPLMLSSIALA